MVNVPHITYTLHKKPVVLEKISKDVKYRKVPVTYSFKEHTYPVQVIKSPGCPMTRKPKSPSCGTIAP
jgi:hypothetical protein